MTANDTDAEEREPTDEGEKPGDDEPPGGYDGAFDDAAPREDGSALGTQRSLTEYVQWALLGILLLVTVIATLRFYFAASTAVDRFVTRQYRPLFQAGFNLIVLLAAGVGLSLLAAGVGLSLLVRRLS